MFKGLLFAGAASAIPTNIAASAELKIGITLGCLGNPFFVALSPCRMAQAKALTINPKTEMITGSADYEKA
jgi:ABC-type sugar transport system substrate-binding protein